MQAEAPPSVRLFLEAIHQEVLPLGVRDLVAVERMLRSEADWSRAELRAGLASLLATDPVKWRQVVTLFDQYYPEAGQEKEEETAGGRESETDRHVEDVHDQVSIPFFRRLWLSIVFRPTWAIVGLGSLSIALLVFVLNRPHATENVTVPATLEPVQTLASPSTPSHLREGEVRLEVVAPERRVIRSYRVTGVSTRDGLWIAAGLVAWCMSVLGIRWWWLPPLVAKERERQVKHSRLQAEAQRARLAEDQAQTGGAWLLSYQVPELMPLPPAAIEDSAALLGRLYRQERGTDLDVNATLRATVNAAGRLVPLYEPNHLAHELIVLVDRESGDHPWLAGFEAILKRWERLGVHLVRFDFRFIPEDLYPHGVQGRFTLEDLARHYEAQPLLIFSRRLSTSDREGPARWVEALSAWPQRAWLDPDPRDDEERKSAQRNLRQLRKAGLVRFPYTGPGLVALARFFAAEGVGINPPEREPLPPLDNPVVNAALERWAATAAMVPDARWDQLEVLRQHFPDLRRDLPDGRYLQRLLEWVSTRTGENAESADGRTLALTDALADALIRDQRQRDRALPREERLEIQTRELLRRQLLPNQPDGILPQLLWRLKVATHDAVLEPDRALELLSAFYGTAVEEEARAVVAEELDRGELSVFSEPTRRGLEVLQGSADGVPARDLWRGRRELWWPAIGAASALLGVSVGLTSLYRAVVDPGGGLLARPLVTSEVIVPAIREVVYGPAAGQGKDIPLSPETEKQGAQDNALYPGATRAGNGLNGLLQNPGANALRGTAANTRVRPAGRTGGRGADRSASGGSVADRVSQTPTPAKEGNSAQDRMGKDDAGAVEAPPGKSPGGVGVKVSEETVPVQPPTSIHRGSIDP